MEVWIIVFEGRKYAIIKNKDIGLVNFEEVLDTSPETVRKSVLGDMVVIKWDSENNPNFLSTLSDYSGPYSHEQIIENLSNNAWKIEEVPKP